MGAETEGALLVFHPLTLFLVLSVLWIIGGPVLATLVSTVVSNVTSDFMMHPTIRMFTVSSHDTSADPNDKNMRFIIRENFIEMCRGIFLVYGALGLMIIPTFINILLSRMEFVAPSDTMGHMATSMVNLLLVGGVVIGSHLLAVRMRDRLYHRVAASGNRKDPRH